MIVVRVELHSALTRQVTEIARLHICNFGGTRAVGNYDVRTLRGRSKLELDRHIPQRTGTVMNHPRLDKHVWHLVGKALASVGYVKPQPHESPDHPGEMGQPVLAIEGPVSEADIQWLQQAWAARMSGERADA